MRISDWSSDVCSSDLTVTYMLDGHMQHQDHLGNVGDLAPGSVQWMTAARGIIHSEMPQQSEGRMRGFQLWLNLPAREKMKHAGYRDIAAADVLTVQIAAGVELRVIAGPPTHGTRSIDDPVQAQTSPRPSEALYLTVQHTTPT